MTDPEDEGRDAVEEAFGFLLWLIASMILLTIYGCVK